MSGAADDAATDAGDSDTTAILLVHLAQLEKTLDAETRCLLEGDPAALHDVSHAKEAALGEVERITATLRGADAGAQMDAWFAAVEPDADRRLALRTAIERCALRNRANGRILMRLRGSNARQLALLTGRPAETLGYASGGTELQSDRSRSLAQA